MTTVRPVSTPAPLRLAALTRLLGRLLCLLALGVVAQAADPILMPRNVEPSDPQAKISSLLRTYVDHAPADGAILPALRRASAGTSRPGVVPVRLDVAVTAANLLDISATGAHVLRTSARWHSVRVEATLSQVRALALLPAIHGVVLARPLMRRSQPGTVFNQADSVIATDQLRATYGVNGGGQTVGIISDSINDSSEVGPGTVSGTAPNATLSGTTPQQSGDLPASIRVVDFGTPAQDGSTDEGEAMMEEIYHLAPGASYAFATAGAIDTDMADNIQALASQAGCTVICDDVGFTDEPMFQDGPIAQAANAFVAGGGSYLAAAGNDADQGILQPYASVTPGANDSQSNGTPNGRDFHDWGHGTSNGFLPLAVSGNLPTLTIILQWNQPFSSYGLGAGSQADFDLYLYKAPSATPANLLSASTDTQGSAGSPSGDPVEFLQYDLPTNTQTVYLAIDHVRGVSDCLLRVLIDVAFGSFSTANYSQIFGIGTCYGHPAAQNVLAIGAVDWQSPTLMEAFTSKGGWGAQGLPFYFDVSGNPLPNAPQLRNKPDLTAPDGVSVSVADFTPFFGTSAATPNAGAVATLVRSAYPSLTGVQVATILEGTATDLTSAPASSGPDAWSGFGLVNALAAAMDPVVNVSSTAANGSYESGTLPLQITFASPVTVSTTGGVPSILLDTSPPQSAVYSSGSGSATLTFTYTLVHGDTAALWDVSSRQALSLNGGTITEISNGTAAGLTLPPPGGPGSLSVNHTITIDAVGPTLGITSVPTISNHPAFTFTFTFQRPVSGFTASAITLVNGVAGALSGSGTTYTLPVTANAPGVVSASVAANAVVDGVGYGNLAGAGSATYDITPPTLTITPIASSATTGDGDVVTFQFSKIVTGFTASSVVLVGGQPGVFAGSGATYTMNVLTGPPGTLTISVLAGSVSDLAGNTLAVGATATVTVNAHSSSKHCGIGSIFGILLLGGVGWYRRRRYAQRAS